jgi:hypothetical protein
LAALTGNKGHVGPGAVRFLFCPFSQNGLVEASRDALGDANARLFWIPE